MPLVSSSGSLGQFNGVHITQVGGNYVRRIQAGQVELIVNTVRDDTTGSPIPPSQKQGRRGILKDILWPVQPGPRTIKIDVNFQPNDGPVFPTMRLKADADVGIPEDVIVQAASGSVGWVTVGPIGFTARQAGVVQVWREWLHLAESGSCNWDNLQVT